LTSALVWLLALAVSIDGFSAGLSCGLRKLAIPFTSLLVICFSSAAAVAISMSLGIGVAQLVPPHYITAFGGTLLIAIGICIIYQNSKEANRQVSCEPAGSKKSGLARLISLILKPEDADLDHSGTLSMKEALLLGTALAADAFSAGFGAALSGLPLPATVLAVGVSKLILFPCGVLCGRFAAQNSTGKYTGLLGGVLLIGIGIMSML